MRLQVACGIVPPQSLAVSISSSSHAPKLVHTNVRRWAMPRCRLQVTRANAPVELERSNESLVSSVGTPLVVSVRDWFRADKQLMVISASAFVTAGFMAILLAAAIPSLLAMKKAAEALEKLADAAREELPATMAAIRLSGMEISDLTMELNGLGHEISKGAKSSARALNAVESGMRQVGGLATNVWQKQAVVPAQAMQPLIARVYDGVKHVGKFQVFSRVSSWIGSLQARSPILAIPFFKKGHQP